MDTDSSAARIAVLIDADNVSSAYAEAILDEIASYGTPTIKRAYGDFSSSRLQKWTRELNARAIRAMHQNAFTTGKNSTDLALVIDAMDLLYANNVDAFAIVSSDSDFTGLVHRLREGGKTVYGLGRKNTVDALQNACDKFIQLEVLGAEGNGDDSNGDEVPETPETRDGEGGAAAETPPPPKINLQSALTKAVNATSDDHGWARLSGVGDHLARSHPSFDPRTFGHSKLSSLVREQPYLQTRSEGAGMQVALKGKASTGSGTARKAAAGKSPTKKATAKKTAAKKD
ncbi:NYN domain-containing protein [Nocardioides sp. GCM10027113]|uniref:NYN domain-containing protein n=1 Tax=unclassified Nocardioides TaxID=2615069 RepID=UPI003611C3F2